MVFFMILLLAAVVFEFYMSFRLFRYIMDVEVRLNHLSDEVGVE